MIVNAYCAFECEYITKEHNHDFGGAWRFLASPILKSTPENDVFVVCILVGKISLRELITFVEKSDTRIMRRN